MKPTQAPVLWLRRGLVVQDAIRGRVYRIEKFLGTEALAPRTRPTA